MKLAEFNKLCKNCPWTHTRFIRHTQKKEIICRGASFVINVGSVNGQPDFAEDGGNKLCCKKNCAILYWLNRK